MANTQSETQQHHLTDRRPSWWLQRACAFVFLIPFGSVLGGSIISMVPVGKLAQWVLMITVSIGLLGVSQLYRRRTGERLWPVHIDVLAAGMLALPAAVVLMAVLEGYSAEAEWTIITTFGNVWLISTFGWVLIVGYRAVRYDTLPLLGGLSGTDGQHATGQQGSKEPLEGEWKHNTFEAERAHRRAQQREPPVEISENVSFPVREVDYQEGQARGQVEKFQIFVDQDVPLNINKGQMICVQIMDWATNEDGNKVGAHARFIKYDTC